jgi:hypothetical protein
MRLTHSRAAAYFTALAALTVLLPAAPAAAQQPQVQFPRLSPNATVTQVIGVTEVTLRYSRPGVKGRKIWGELVPYGEVWRSGANENTTISFSTPVKVEGTELPAGTYGLQTIPTEGDWTLILSKDADAWGAFEYKPENDALRATVKPQPSEHPHERLQFTFEDLTDTSANVVLAWEKVEVPFKLEVDTPKLVLAKANETLRWQTPYQAANYCLDNNTCLDEAERWLAASLAMGESFWNHRAMARLREKKNDTAGAIAHAEKALAAAKAATNPPPANIVAELETSLAGWKSKASGK